MATCKALVIEDKGKAGVQDVSVPKLRDQHLLVRTTAVGLNPADWRHLDGLGDPGARLGCDYAGVVEEVGGNATRSFQKGDRVAGFAHGG